MHALDDVAHAIHESRFALGPWAGVVLAAAFIGCRVIHHP